MNSISLSMDGSTQSSELVGIIQLFEQSSSVQIIPQLHEYCNKNKLKKLLLCLLSLQVTNPSDFLRYATEGNLNDILSSLHVICPTLLNIAIRPPFKLTGTSNTSIIPWNGKYLINARVVNYRLDNDGRFMLPEGIEYFQSSNVALVFSESLDKVEGEKVFTNNDQPPVPYRGIEDIRILEHPVDKTIYYIGTMCHDSKLVMTHGIYDIEASTITMNPICSPYLRAMEKNWCMFFHQRDLKFVYQWYPLEIGHIKNGSLQIQSRKYYNDLLFLKRVKGSSCGVSYNGMVWFLVHFHSEETTRQYYHAFIVLDEETLAIKKISAPFNFEKERIEFGMGLVVNDSHIIITYTVLDRDARIGIYERGVMEQLLFQDKKSIVHEDEFVF